MIDEYILVSSLDGDYLIVMIAEITFSIEIYIMSSMTWLRQTLIDFCHLKEGTVILLTANIHTEFPLFLNLYILCL